MERLVTTEFRATSSEGGMTGHASVFDSYARIADHWENVSTRAFDRAIDEKADVRLLLNHDPNHLLARTKSGTLSLSSDDKGLVTNADIADTQAGRDVRTLIDRGDLSGMSFGFVVKKDSWSVAPDGRQLRTIEDVDLFDVSVVTFPAYEGANDIQLRAADFGAPNSSADANRRRLIHVRSRHLAAGKQEG